MSHERRRGRAYVDDTTDYDSVHSFERSVAGANPHEVSPTDRDMYTQRPSRSYYSHRCFSKRFNEILLNKTSPQLNSYVKCTE